jgi:hypothetical protein
VRPEDEIINDGDDEVVLPDEDVQARNGDVEIRDGARGARFGGPNAQQEHFSPWSPSSWKRRFTSLFGSTTRTQSDYQNASKRKHQLGNTQNGAAGDDLDGLTDAEREARCESHISFKN